MSVAFDTIRAEVEELIANLAHDVALVAALPKGGNYAAALLITTACEALGSLRYPQNGGWLFFHDYLLPPSHKGIAKSLFDAVRNGLAHGFHTKSVVQMSGEDINICISWSQQPHLRYDEDRRTLMLNVQDLSAALQNALSRYRIELEDDAVLRDRFYQGRRKESVTCPDSGENDAWRIVLRPPHG
jgi:hypothetical protein